MELGFGSLENDFDGRVPGIDWFTLKSAIGFAFALQGMSVTGFVHVSVFADAVRNGPYFVLFTFFSNFQDSLCPYS